MCACLNFVVFIHSVIYFCALVVGGFFVCMCFSPNISSQGNYGLRSCEFDFIVYFVIFNNY